jgi:hypothetical protein
MVLCEFRMAVCLNCEVANRLYLKQSHPEVKFQPGPFYMGSWGLYINIIMVSWTGE